MNQSNASIDTYLNKLFPICRSLTGQGNIQTFEILSDLVPGLKIHSIPSGTHIFDWQIPPEWNVVDAFILNNLGEKIVSFSENNLHLMSYSSPFSGTLTKDEFLEHVYTLPDHPDWIPYRTTYYSRKWGFCLPTSLLESDKFTGPFSVLIDTQLDPNGQFNYATAYKQGVSKDEILISTYCCHPSLANDNLSGLLTASLLFNALSTKDTRFSYSLAIVPETIGALAYLKEQNTENVKGAIQVTCTGGPDVLSIKHSFDSDSWIDKIASSIINEYTQGDYIDYPFVPSGSDERQYSSPGFRIPTISYHKSKYHDYPQYHTSADNLDFISSNNISICLELYLQLIDALDSYCIPNRLNPCGEYFLGKRGLYPNVGGSLKQPTCSVSSGPLDSTSLIHEGDIQLTHDHMDAFYWVMHCADGSYSNIDIARRSELPLKLINDVISLFLRNNLLELCPSF